MDAYSKKDIQEGKFFAIISYISFLCIVSLILKKENKFVLLHAKQGLVLFVIEVVIFIFSIIPFHWIIKIAVFIFFVVISLIGILQALQGTSRRIPIISDLAEKVVL